MGLISLRVCYSYTLGLLNQTLLFCSTGHLEIQTGSRDYLGGSHPLSKNFTLATNTLHGYCVIML